MGNFQVGKPLGGETNEMRLNWIEAQIAERKSAIARFKLDIEDLTNVKLRDLQRNILQKEEDIKALTGQRQNINTVDV